MTLCLWVVLAGCGTTAAAAGSSGASTVVPRTEVPAEDVDCQVEKCVALSFDGGPGEHTTELLDTLKKRRVGATFFLLGNRHIERYPEVVRRIADEGHEVANHTWTHPRLTDIEPSEARVELVRTQRAIERLTGRAPTLMRPPQGATNPDVSRVARSLGLAQVLWTITAKDYSTTDSALITRRVLDQARRDRIILLHDIYDGTVPAVPAIIDGLEKRGFTVVTVSQLFAPDPLYPGRIYRDAWVVRE